MKNVSSYIILGIFALGGIAIWLLTGEMVMLAFAFFVLVLASIIW